MTGAPLKVHITGVYGLIGNLMYRHLSAQPGLYDVYGSGRRAVSSTRAGTGAVQLLPDDHFMIADLSDAGAVKAAVAGMDAVLHIGAAPGPETSFDVVLESNIRGTYNVLEACREAGVYRLVYASSIMVSFGYVRHAEPYRAIREGRWEDIPDSMPYITHQDPSWPTEPYSASKVYAESLCRTYYDRFDISVVCLRIGYVNKEDVCRIPTEESNWFSHRDCVDFFDRALKRTASPIYDICYGVSDNKYRWVDLDHSRNLLGFMPKDSHEARYAEIG